MMREQFRQLTTRGPAWTIINLKESALRSNIARISRIELPNQQLGYLVSIQDMERISRAFKGKGYYALTDQNHLVYTSPGFDTSLVSMDAPELAPGETYLSHPKAKLLVMQAFQVLPWAIYYTPTAANQFGIEWPITLTHIILYLLGLTLSFFLYKKAKRLVLEPTQQVLTTLLNYHSELTRRNKELSSANESAMQAMKTRSLFLAAMSHEIRTPLNGIMAMLELLGREPLSSRQQHAYSLIKSSSDLLLYLIDEILDYTRIQSGKIQFVHEPTLLSAVFNTIAETFRIKIEQSAKPIKFVFKNTVPTEITALIDPFRLNQVIGNLLTNALKFTETGTIRFECSLSDGSSGDIVLRIVDTGIGITKEQLARIFQPFEQADASLTHKYGGSGLGLAICQGIVEQLGGTIMAESLPDLGSAFTVRIPCQLVTETGLPARFPSLTQATEGSLQGKVFIVEDHPINQAVLEELLKELNVDMVSVSSAEEALSFLNSSPLSHIAVILTDISLPGMDGYEFASVLRSQYGAQLPPLVAISAHAFASDIERAKMDGFVDYLTKPISLERLETVLKRIGLSTRNRVNSSSHGETPNHLLRNELPPVDFAQWRRIFGNSPDTLITALIQFLECDPRDRQHLEEADRIKLGYTAHQMAGAAVYLDTHYAKCLQELEKIADTAPIDILIQNTEQAVAYSRHVEVACRQYLQQLQASN